MTDFLSINTIAFTVLGYPMSYIELIGTILYLWSVWLIARKQMLTWPVGIVSVLLYMSLFYQIRLYSDALEQVYYLIASFYGWWWWSQRGPAEDVTEGFRYSHRRSWMLVLGITLGIGLALGGLMSQIHEWLPRSLPGCCCLSTAGCGHDRDELYGHGVDGSETNRKLVLLDCGRCGCHWPLLRQGCPVSVCAVCDSARYSNQWITLLASSLPGCKADLPRGRLIFSFQTGSGFNGWD
jgi:hypothetical protein